MKILSLETSSKNCSVAISENEQLLCLCEEISENYKQSESLHVFVQWALEGAEIGIDEIDAVCLGSGPGSYTGLRIGAAAAKGFCYGRGIPLIAVDSLETMIATFVGKDFDIIVPLVDARRMEVYTATFCGKTGARLSGTQALILDENSFADLHPKRVLFVGDGAKKAEEIIVSDGFEFRANVFPSAEFLVRPAYEKFNQKKFEDVAYFEPFYLKEFQGVKKKS